MGESSHSGPECGPDKRFGHESAIIGTSIHLFGGKNDKGEYFPRDKIHEYDIGSQKWEVHTAEGVIPPPCCGASCVVIDGSIYSYGGMEDQRESNDHPPKSAPDSRTDSFIRRSFRLIAGKGSQAESNGCLSNVYCLDVKEMKWALVDMNRGVQPRG
eukprot:m.105729 g.105729  ORF g.105729 m.105729 type:complete len:157 (+) comp37232_c0_seq27:275-745(+)